MRERVLEANSISTCLNEMYSDNFSVSGSLETHAQRRSQHSIFQQLGRQKKPNKKCTEREAIKELLHTEVSYDGGANLSTVRSYKRDLVSLPEVGATLVPLSQVLDPIGRDVVGNPLESMLIPEDAWGEIAEKEAGFRPYMDTILQNDKQKYNQFIRDLFDKNMVDFTANPKDLIAPFFVKKKNHKLRLVLDCRGVNRRFHPPPPMALSAGSTWGQVSLPTGKQLYVAQSDIKDYFYSLALPESLRDLFCLPAVPATLLKDWQIPQDSIPEFDDGGWVYPRLRAVPMGWSWAMWISQRAHQHIALQASGLGVERLLVEGRPCPDLSRGEAILIPYADNLNVAGTDAERVQSIKDSVVNELRRLGFRVHEETDSCTLAQSLGFLIDGAAGVILPIPERLDKILKAFHWLAQRPVVDGRSVERLLGHAVHICLLRRELLSLFRSLYDFVYDSYSTRQTLWASAAREARWCSHVLKLCSVDMRRQWAESVTASDASLSGIAVCKRSMSVAEQTRLGDLKEHWRYKSHIPCNPRQTAVSQKDPFSDISTVRPIAENVSPDPFELDVNFQEVDQKFLQPKDWTECFAVRMMVPEHITILEGRGVIAALRHQFRAVDNFGKKLLHFCDNMSMTLLLAKGRSGTYTMLRICRRVACLLLATDSFLSIRWIPSELNIADKPSRRWESLRTADAACRAQEKIFKKEVYDRCYPNGSKGGGIAQTSPSGSGGFSAKSSQTSVSRASSPHSGSEKIPAGRETGGKDRGSKVCGSDSAGNSGRVKTSSSGLHETYPRTQSFRQEDEVKAKSEEQLRLGLLQVCQQHVQPRLRLPRRNQNFSCHHRCLPRLRPQAHVMPNQKGFAGMAQSRATDDKASYSMATNSFDVLGDDHDGKKKQRIGHPPHVHSVPEARRAFRPAKGRPRSTNARISVLCPSPSSSSTRTAVQGGSVGRVADVGLPTTPLVGSGTDEHGDTSHIPHRFDLRSVGEGLEIGSQAHGVGSESCCSLSAPALGAKFRQTTETSKSPGSQTEGKMELRHQCKEVRGACPHLSGIPSSSSKSPGTVCQVGGEVQQGGPRTFCPPPDVSSKKKKYMLEIFSGCARLSRACANAGFWSIAYDIEYGHNCDVLNSKVFDKLVRFIKRNASLIALVWCGTPCTTWSRARKHDGGPPPLRDDGENLWGFSDLSMHDGNKIEQGNNLLFVTAKLCQLCDQLHVPWVIENPATSRIWLTSTLKEFFHTGAFFVTTDFCAFGMPWRKSTGFLCSRFENLKHISKHCTSQHGRCTFTNRRHIILSGKDSSGMWLTKRAQPYPPQLCMMIADVLANTT